MNDNKSNLRKDEQKEYLNRLKPVSRIVDVNDFDKVSNLIKPYKEYSDELNSVFYFNNPEKNWKNC